jgi:hypothetical protein
MYTKREVPLEEIRLLFPWNIFVEELKWFDIFDKDGIEICRITSSEEAEKLLSHLNRGKILVVIDSSGQREHTITTAP